MKFLNDEIKCKRVLAFLFLFFYLNSLFAAAPQIIQEIEDAFVKVGEKVGPAVVTINVVQILERSVPQGRPRDPFFNEFFDYFFRGQPREYRQQGLGSGFIISEEGYIITNEHVVGDADEIKVTLPDGRVFSAKLIGSDMRNDIAVIKIDGENLPVVRLGNSENTRPGEWVLAFGNPFGNVVNNPKPTMTSGIISAIHRTITVREDDRMYGDLIQTDAAINVGNSGGPLVNLDGEVIGINTLIFSPSGGNVGIGFAIPINRGKQILDDLIQGKEIKHPWLGVWLQDLTDEIMRQFNVPENQRGALIFRVEENSPAAQAGLQSGDIILQINRQQIGNSLDVTRIISGNRPGDLIDMEILRQGRIKQIRVELTEREERSKRRQTRPKEGQQEYSWRGLSVVDITDEIQKRLGLQSKQGVVVTNIEFRSPAQESRIRPGDVIYSIAQQPVNSEKDFENITQNLPKEEEVLLQTSRGYLVIK